MSLVTAEFRLISHGIGGWPWSSFLPTHADMWTFSAAPRSGFLIVLYGCCGEVGLSLMFDDSYMYYRSSLEHVIPVMFGH